MNTTDTPKITAETRITVDESDAVLRQKRFDVERDIINGVRNADGTKRSKSKTIGYRPTHVVAKPKEPAFRLPAQIRYDAEMRGDEQSKRAALIRRAKRITVVLRTAMKEGEPWAHAMGLGGELTKFKRADFDRTIRACEALLARVSARPATLDEQLASLPVAEPSNDVHPEAASFRVIQGGRS
jgi:hypothetical protein